MAVVAVLVDACYKNNSAISEHPSLLNITTSVFYLDLVSDDHNTVVSVDDDAVNKIVGQPSASPTESTIPLAVCSQRPLPTEVPKGVP